MSKISLASDSACRRQPWFSFLPALSSSVPTDQYPPQRQGKDYRPLGKYSHLSMDPMFMVCAFKLLNIWEVMLKPVNSQRRKQLTEMRVFWCVGWCCWCISECVCVRKRIYDCVCGIPAEEQIRNATPNSQSGAELSIKGNLWVWVGMRLGKQGI